MSIEGQGHFLTLAKGHLHMKLELVFLSVITGPFSAKFLMLACRNKEIKIHQHNAGHMTKMAAMPISGKILQKSSFHEPLE